MRGVALVSIAFLAACDVPPPTPEQAAERCEKRARSAQGPEFSATVGVNSKTGAFGGGSVGVSTDFLRGLDPVAVYESCVQNLTGEPPIRPPQLR